MTDATVWQDAKLTRKFLSGIRAAIPFAAEQLAVMLRVIAAAQSNPAKMLDLGCGDGVVGAAVMAQYSAMQGVFVDFSAPMLDAAKARFSEENARVEVILGDYSDPQWVSLVQPFAPFDVIVSGYSIHHQPDARKRALYRELFDLLSPGGIFVNMEHVAPASKWLEDCFEELFVDSLYAHHQRSGSQKSREQLAQELYNRADKAANVLTPADEQCGWLRAIGYQDVEVYFKIFELAVLGGIHPQI